MKAVWRNTLLCFVLAAAMLAQCASAAFAASDPTPQIWYLQGGVPDENGVMTREYWVDADGSRMPEETTQSMPKRARAAGQLPRNYDLRDYGLLTPVKFQAGAESCWVFASIAALESSYIRQGYGTVENTDFSEAHLVWFGLHQRTPDTTDPTYGDGLEIAEPFLRGGSWQYASSAILRGSGIQLEQNAPWITTYDTEKLKQMAQPESERYVSYARAWDVRKAAVGSTAEIKQMVMENGPVTVSYYDNYAEYQRGRIPASGYSPDRRSYYQTEKTDTYNHTVAVVGWDDDYPRDNFSEGRQPSSDGAWLVRGSWSASWADQGYYWISYEEPSFDNFVSFTAAPVEIYDHIYQYDGTYPRIQFTIPPRSGSSVSSGKIANVFTAERDELLTHVVFYSSNTKSIKVTAEVYTAPEGFVYSGTNPVNGMTRVDAATTTFSGMTNGYSTLELNAPVYLTAGQKFSVVVTMEMSGGSVQIPVEGTAVANPPEGAVTYSGSVGTSFIGYYDQWFDSNNYSGTDYNNVPLKAMTRDVSPQAETLTLLKQPDKTTYLVGESPDLTGLSLLYTDADGNPSVITDGYSCDTGTFGTPGTQTVSVTYNGLSASFDSEVIVQSPTLSLVSAPQTTAYMVGDTVDTTGLALRYTDEYGAEHTVTDGYSYSPHVLRSIGTKTVNVTYNDLSVSFDVTSEPYETAMSLRSAPTKTTYYINETLNTAGLSLDYSDEYGKTRVVTSGFSCDPTTLSAVGTQTVTVAYKDRSVTFDVTVEPYEPTLALWSEPDKTTYYINETLDTTGLSLLYTDEYGDAFEVYEGFNCSPVTFTAFGTQTVTTEYNGLSVSFDVTVEPYEPTLEVYALPDKTVYYEGETLDTTGLTLLYTDEYGDAFIVDDGFACDPETLGTTGTQTVTAVYNGLSATFDVTVNAVGVFLVSDASARAGETVDVAVRIQNNPGIVSAWLELDYDAQTLELTAVRNGAVFANDCLTGGGDLTAVPYRVLFVDALAQTNYTQDGDLVIFTFRVRTDAPAGDTTLRLTHREKSTCSADLQIAPFRTQDGTFTVQRLPGDVNADGNIDLKDVVMLRRYLAGWDVTVNLDNADVDEQEDVDVRDVVYITRFLADGYDLVLH